MPRKRRPTLEAGIRDWKGGWQAYITVRGRRRFKNYAGKEYPLGPPLDKMRAWREKQRGLGGVPDPEGSFGADIAAHNQRVSAMPTAKQCAAHLELWAQALGRDRPSDSITAADIDIVLQDWLKTKSPKTGKVLAPTTVKKRRTHLQAFFKKRNGDHGATPVKGTSIPQAPELEARGLDYILVGRILDAMPTYHSAKPDAPKVLSLSKIRATVLAYTGLPPGMLKKVHPTDLVLSGEGSLRVRPRRKGKGIAAQTLPLLAEGLAAFKVFHAANAYGEYAIESVNRSFKRAAKSCGIDPGAVHLYDLRHSFGAELYRVTKDLATVARFMLHAEGSPVTARYAKGANKEVDAAAAKAMSAALVDARRQTLKSAPSARPLTTARQKSA